MDIHQDINYEVRKKVGKTVEKVFTGSLGECLFYLSRIAEKAGLPYDTKGDGCILETTEASYFVSDCE